MTTNETFRIPKRLYITFVSVKIILKGSILFLISMKVIISSKVFAIIPTSNPMSFWTEQDILLYIKLHEDEMINNGMVWAERDNNGYKNIFSIICVI